MQYTQLKQAVEIDDQITNLHKELSGLYAKKALFVEAVGFTDTHRQSKPGLISIPAQDPWISQTYFYLANAWMAHGIAIPDYTALNKKLAKACKIIRDISVNDPAVGQQLGVLLVPPSSLMHFPLKPHVRSTQKHILMHDYINPDLLNIPMQPKTSWQVLVAHTGKAGFSYGSAAEILTSKKYIIAGYDMRAMGLRQYAALTVQVNQIIDQDVWAILLGDRPLNNTLVPSATFIKGQYRFDLDEPNSILGEETFRPAIEVKA